MDSVGVKTFQRHTHLVRARGITLNRNAMVSLDMGDRLKAKAKELLGEDVTYLNDIMTFRGYLKEIFGVEDGLLFFRDESTGEITINLQHMLLFTCRLKEQEHPKAYVAEGLLYYLASEHIQETQKRVGKTFNKNFVEPAFNVSPQTFGWKRCPEITHKQVMRYTIPDGYKGFCFERPSTAILSYLLHTGQEFDDAVAILEKSTGGQLLSYLKGDEGKKVEHVMAEYLMSGKINNFDGLLGSSLFRTIQETNIKYINNLDIYNVFNLYVKPTMLEIVGRDINKLFGTISQYPEIAKNDIYIYHISPYRFAVAIKEGTNVEKYIPAEMQAIMTPVSTTYESEMECILEYIS